MMFLKEGCGHRRWRGLLWGALMVLCLAAVGGCGDVANLLDEDAEEEGAFSSIDKTTKNKFAKIEGLDPSEPITLKVELFSFASTDTQALTNLTQKSFDPVLDGAEQLSGGIIQFKNGFTTVLKLINSKSCGKFSLADLAVLLCPDTSDSGVSSLQALSASVAATHVAFSATQSLALLLGPSLLDLFDLTALAKFTPEQLAELEESIRKALSNTLESSQKTTTEAAGETKISQAQQEAENPGSVTGTTPTGGGSGSTGQGGGQQGGGQQGNQPQPSPTPPAPQFGDRPTSHVESSITIPGISAATTGHVTFAGDYIVLGYASSATGGDAKNIRIYSKDITNGLQFWAKHIIEANVESVDALGVSTEALDTSTDDDVIYVAGRPASTVSKPDHRVFEFPFNKTLRTFGSEKKSDIPNTDFDTNAEAEASRYGTFYKSQGVIHRTPAGDPDGGVRFVTSGTNSTSADFRALFEEGNIGASMARVMWAVLPYQLLSFELIDVMYKNGEPTYYFGEYRLQGQAGTYKHAMWFYNQSTSGTGETEAHMDYGGGGIRIDYLDFISSGGNSNVVIKDASYFDSDSNIIGLSWVDPNGDKWVGTARLDGGRGTGITIAWNYMMPVPAGYAVLDIAFDIYETGNLLVVMLNGSGNLKLVSYKLSY